MKLRPLFNNVIVVQDEHQESQFGNIIIADAGGEKPKTGTVIEAGPGVYSISGELVTNQVKVGDRICFGGFSGVKFSLDGKEYICIKDTEVLTIIEE